MKGHIRKRGKRRAELTRQASQPAEHGRREGLGREVWVRGARPRYLPELESKRPLRTLERFRPGMPKAYGCRHFS